MQFYRSKLKQFYCEKGVQHWFAEFVIRVNGIRFSVIFEEVVEEIIEENLVNNIEEKSYNEMEEEVVILDSGSDVSLLPKRHQRNLEGSTLGCRLQNCQGGTLEVAGVKHAELHGPRWPPGNCACPP